MPSNRKYIKMPPLVIMAISLIALNFNTCSGLPFDPNSISRQNQNPLGSGSESQNQSADKNTSGSQILVEGSPQYNTMVQQQRNWSLADSSRSSLNNAGGGGGNATNVNGTLNANQTACLHSSSTLCLHSVRDKQLRLMNIRDYVLSTLGYGKAPPTPVSKAVFSAGDDMAKTSDTPFSGDIKRSHASCEVPARVDTDVWTNPEYFHVYFKFPVTSDNNGTSNSTESVTSTRAQRGVTTISAKLRLYKIGVGSNAESPKYEEPASEPCNETEITQQAQLQITTVLAETVLDEKIRVSVYWYKAPVQKTHYKKKLLDTKMLSVKESKWVDFDIINAAVPWMDHQEKNFGLVVQVENEDDDLLNPNKYFVNVHCSENGSVSIGEAQTATPPMIEICTLNTPHTPREIPTEESEQPSFFPFPMGQSFNLLSRVAKAHANNAANRDTGSDWQNDDLPKDDQDEPTFTTTTQAPSHKHRHRHGLRQKNKHSNQNHQQNTQNTPQNDNGFKLDEDHPLRRILATVASNVNSNSRENRNHHKNSRHSSSTKNTQEVDVGGDYSSESDRDIIIQKIYITSPNSNRNSDSSDMNLNR